ncbi:MAG TPA: DoxX family protein [Candidatus Methylomirabilis sp.]|nr:DoxX family protein [Candidatus Methylomirabilis sp.]
MKEDLKCENRNHDWAVLFLRLALAFILVFHGYGKLFGTAPGMEGFIGFVTKLGFPLPVVMAYAVAILEFFGGLAIAAGVFTKYVSWLVTIQFAIILLYVKKLAFPGADVDLLVFAIALALALGGSGGYSCDAKMAMKKAKN